MPQYFQRTAKRTPAPPSDTANAPAASPAFLEGLFAEHNRALVSFLTAKLRSESEAQEVAQQAYARLLQLDKPNAVSFQRAYLFRIASNIALDRLRRRNVRKRGAQQVQLCFEQLLTRPGPDQAAMTAQQLLTVKSAVKTLPPKCRRAFLLHFFADRSVAEVASEMNISDRMVRYHIARGLAHCRSTLDTEN